MIAIKKIVFATDFSDCARAAQEYAVALAGQFHAALHVLYVMPDVTMMMPEAGMALSMPENYLTNQKKEAQLALDKLLPDAVKDGLSIVRSLRLGNPFVEIVKYAEETGADLIVVGTHGRGAFMHLLLGSVAEKVVRKAKCPVLSVRPPNAA
jgi:nucleotide-binding universal stress UspA family protein